MNDTTSTIYCSNCREVIPADTSYCTECGAKQNTSVNSKDEKNSEFLPADKKYCGKCGDTIDIATSYCGSCGAEQGDTVDSEVNGGISEWAIGLSKGNTIQNVAAGVFFYAGLYPIGIPVLLYSYLYYKRNYSRISVVIASIVCAIVLSITLLIF